MVEDTWRPARIIPTSGIRGAREKETRATSALLSVLGAVDEFGKAILRGRLGAPAGKIECFIEVEFEVPGRSPLRPDGLITVRRGQRTWTALVEVKTGTAELDKVQVEDYLDLARLKGYDAVVTISNQILPATGDHPVVVSKKKLGSVKLHHISWVALLTEAVIVRKRRGVRDREQKWILSELIAYLEHPNSGAMRFMDMGKHWTKVRESARARTLRQSDAGVEDVVERWGEFSRYLCLHLGRKLGADVQQVLLRRDKNDPAGHRSRLARELADDGMLRCTLRVPGAVADINIQADLPARTVSASLSVDAPRDRNPRARVNWLVRQLRTRAPSGVQIITAFESRSVTTSRPLDVLIANPGDALLEDRRVPPRGFTVTLGRDMGTQRSSGTRLFVGSVTALLHEFYGDVAGNLKAWPRAPRHPGQSQPETADDPPGEIEANRFVHTDDDGPLHIMQGDVPPVH